MNNGIIVENASFKYRNSKTQLRDINVEIPQGSFYGITGINGSGKTTFIQFLNGLIPHEVAGDFKGNVFIDGENTRKKPVSYFAKKVGMLFQNPDFMLFNLTAAEEISFGLNNLKLVNNEERIKNALDVVGLSGFEGRDPQTLSLGEKQRLALACILALDTEYIVLDEPAAMMDFIGAVNLYKLLINLNKELHKTIIVIEHDTDFLLTFTQKTIVMHEGKIILHDDTGSVFHNKNNLKQIGIKSPHIIS